MSGQVTLRGVSVGFGARRVLSDVDLTVAAGDRLGVVAPNGVGKSTLLRVIAGELAPESGVVVRAPASATVLRLAQEPTIEGARIAARSSGPAHRGGRGAPGRWTPPPRRWRRASGRNPTTPRPSTHWLALGGADFDERAAAVIADLGLPDDLLHRGASGALRRAEGAAGPGRGAARPARPAAARRADQRPRRRRPAPARGAGARDAGRASWWSRTTGRSWPPPSSRWWRSTSSPARSASTAAAGTPTSPSARPPAAGARGACRLRVRAGHAGRAAPGSKREWARSGAARAANPRYAPDPDKNVGTTRIAGAQRLGRRRREDRPGGRAARRRRARGRARAVAAAAVASGWRHVRARSSSTCAARWSRGGA